MEHELSADEEKKLAQLLADVRNIHNKQCEKKECEKVLCAHEAVIAIAMGFKVGARCSTCIADGLDREVEEFRDHVRVHISKRPCFESAWRHAGEIEGYGVVDRPVSLWPKIGESDER